MSKRWSIPLVVLGLIIVAGAVWKLQTAAIPVETGVAKIDTIEQFVDERGKTRVAHTYDITMPLNARLERIELDEGDLVQAGQTVAQVVEADLDLEVAEAQAAVERLQASINENNDHSVEERARQQAEQFVTSMKLTVDAAAASKTASAKRLGYAEKFLERARGLFEKKANTVEDVELADVEYVERQIDYQQDVLNWQSTQSILAATELLPKIIDDYVTRKSLTGEVLAKQKAEAEARLSRARTNRNRGTMTSPVSGVVLEKSYDDEQFISAGSTLLTIGRLDDLEIEVDVLSQDATRIRTGAEVQVYGIGDPRSEETAITARVTRIYPKGFTKISSLGVEQQRVKVIVGIEPSTARQLREMGVGADFRVRVRILTERKQGVMIVPRSALFRDADGGWQTFVIRRGRASLQNLEVGLMNDQDAEIVTGLTEHDTVIVAPENEIIDGARVTAASQT